MKGTITKQDGMIVIKWPASELHGLLVALGECPCKATKSTATANIRARLRKGLTALSSRG